MLRLVGLWQQFQQVNLSVQRLGDIMNTPLPSVGWLNTDVAGQRTATMGRCVNNLGAGLACLLLALGGTMPGASARDGYTWSENVAVDARSADGGKHCEAGRRLEGIGQLPQAVNSIGDWLLQFGEVADLHRPIRKTGDNL
jgi:hypothetical protein